MCMSLGYARWVCCYVPDGAMLVCCLPRALLTMTVMVGWQRWVARLLSAHRCVCVCVRMCVCVHQAWEIWKEHGAWITQHKPTFGPGTKERFAMAAGITEEASNDTHTHTHTHTHAQRCPSLFTLRAEVSAHACTYVNAPHCAQQCGVSTYVCVCVCVRVCAGVPGRQRQASGHHRTPHHPAR